ncbi:hypothetical protein V2J09_007485 [Rumex salicifolius]
MEVMGGASLMDGDWESICRILSFDQDSDIGNSIYSQNVDRRGGETLLGLLMGNTNPSSSTSHSQCELGFPFNNQHLLPTPFSYNLSQFNCGSPTQLVQSCINDYDDDDQISSLTSACLGVDAALLMNPRNTNGDHSMKKRKPDQLEIKAQVPPASNKRFRTADNRKMKRINEEEQKPSSDTSDNESKGSHEEIPKLNRRANRGAATDPQSLYARKRRERINERLRILQTLVPNGTKVDLSTMLEEAVSYVKFLQMQIKPSENIVHTVDCNFVAVVELRGYVDGIQWN